ncbi:MFS transporter [Aeromonas eucrenophila]|uniref:MFS transporter n=1 Tax=Aeromonas eucrenophila TaxID=649 RepID=A0ABW0YBU4_9GAMM|nr:MFS transporter [Aeromonas eucrenophila]
MLSALAMKLPHIDRLATRATFFCSGFATAAWASSIPFIKLNVQLSDGAMGLMLLCLGGGALIGMPVSGICTSRFGCKKVLIGTVSAIALLLPLLVLATSPSALAITLVLYGISIGTTGCTMNIQAIAVEKEANKPLMSGFHGFYSLGGMMGAFVLTLLLTAGITPLAATGITSSLIMALLILSTPGYSTRVVSHSGPYFAMPRGPVFIIGIVCFVFFLAEGTVLDWSGIFLNEYRAVPASAAGMGIVFFSIAMTLGRLLGDGIVARLGARVVVTLGSLIAISGFLVSLSLPYWQTALLGYALIGIGCSNIVPIMFSAAGRQNVMPGPLAITAVSSLGYIGVLSGPAIVGFGAEIAGLPASLYGVALLVVLALLLSKRVRLTQAA